MTEHRCQHTGNPIPAVASVWPTRFIEKVAFGEGCWEWQASLNQRGYGRFAIGKHFSNAHRIAYQWVHGELPRDLQVDHLCCNPKCVRPDHMEPVTNTENRRRARWTHCLHGHPLQGNNIIWTTRWYGVGRACRECVNRRQREGRARRKAVAA
jgi:hypothetical protein